MPAQHAQTQPPCLLPASLHVQDAAGLITACRPGLPDYVERFARREPGAAEGAGLLDVVRSVKPTIILGLAGGARRRDDSRLCATLRLTQLHPGHVCMPQRSQHHCELHV